MYNEIRPSPAFVFPVINNDDIQIPKLGGEHGNEYTQPRRLDKDWVLLSIRHYDDLNTYNDKLDELEEYLNYQLERVKFRTPLLYSVNEEEQLDTPQMQYGSTDEKDNTFHVPGQVAQLIVHTDINVAKSLTQDGQSEGSLIGKSGGNIEPAWRTADVDMLRVKYQTGRLYTITELAEPTSSSEPVEVNHTTEAHCVADISNTLLEVHKATPKVGVKDEIQPSIRLHMFSSQRYTWSSA